MRISNLTRRYWIDTLREWAENRLPPPQMDECRQAIEEMCLEASRPTDRGIRLRFVIIGDPQNPLDLVSELFIGGWSKHLDTCYPTEDPEVMNGFAKLYKIHADKLGLHFDRSALDEWLKEQEDPR